MLTSIGTPLETCRNILTRVINFTKDSLYFICYYLSDCQDRIVIRYRAMSPYVFPNIKKNLKLTISICYSFWHHNDSSQASFSCFFFIVFVDVFDRKSAELNEFLQYVTFCMRVYVQAKEVNSIYNRKIVKRGNYDQRALPWPAVRIQFRLFLTERSPNRMQFDIWKW